MLVILVAVVYLIVIDKLYHSHPLSPLSLYLFIYVVLHFLFLPHRCRSEWGSLEELNHTMARDMATSSHTLIPELTLIAVIAKKPDWVVMVATRWFCVSKSIHTCL